MSPVRASSSARRTDQFSGFQSKVIVFDYAGSEARTVAAFSMARNAEKSTILLSFSIICF
jgi:hypothetical protein